MVLISKASFSVSSKLAGLAAAACLMSSAVMAAPLAGPACPADLPEIVVPAPVQGPPTASTRVLRVVARNLPHFAVNIAFEGPFAGGTEAMQVELMRSVADELGLPGAPEAEE